MGTTGCAGAGRRKAAKLDDHLEPLDLCLEALDLRPELVDLGRVRVGVHHRCVRDRTRARRVCERRCVLLGLQVARRDACEHEGVGVASESVLE